MSEQANAINELSPKECGLRLASHTVGRIVTRVGEVIDVFPVNYVVDDEDIVLRTAEGTKLAEMVIGGDVLFEADEFNDHEAWSVVVRGTARVLVLEAEIAAAEALGLKSMAPTVKRNFVRITTNQITGRAFARTGEPPTDGPQDY